MGVETGIVRMDELAFQPLVGVLPDLIVIHFIPPFGIITEACDDLILAIEKRYARLEFRDEHQLAVRVDIRRQHEAIERFEVLAIGSEPLQPVVKAIADND